MKDVSKEIKNINNLIKYIDQCKQGKFRYAKKNVEKIKNIEHCKEYSLNILYSINTHLNDKKQAQKNCIDLVKNTPTTYNYNLLGNFYKSKKNYDLAIKYYLKSIKNPQINKIMSDFKKLQSKIKNFSKSKNYSYLRFYLEIQNFILKVNLNQLVTISRPHFAQNYTNTENFLKEFKKLSKDIYKKKAKNNIFLKKIYKFLKKNELNFKINPDYDNPFFNLGFVNEQKLNFKKAIKYFHLSNLIEKNKRYTKNILEVLYKDNDKKKFIKQLKIFQKEKKKDFSAYAISNFVSSQWNIKNYYQFCDRPMNYILNENLIDKKIISKKFLENLKGIITNFSNHTKTPVVIGLKSLGNLFEIKNKNIEKFKNIIKKMLIVYKKRFKNSNSEMIRNWPKKFVINAWYTKLKKGGEITSHIHHGWVSGVFYIKKPLQNKKDLEISYKYQDLHVMKKKYPKINLATDEGRLVLFPSSLPHKVLPYRSTKVERISIAFDMVPLN